MNFSGALREIEGSYFDTMMGLASGFRLLFDIARKQAPVHVVWKDLDLPENQGAILARIKELAAREVDLQYANFHDTAFITYLWLLSLKNPELAREAAEVILKIPHCFWAEDGARFYLKVGKPLSTAPSPEDEASIATYEER